MELLKTFGLTYVAVLVFYTLYIAAIQMWDNRALIDKPVLYASAPMLLTMVVVDFVMQVTLFTVLFLDLPQETMVTYRLERYKAQPVQDWRSRVAVWICANALNPFDPTRHHC